MKVLYWIGSILYTGIALIEGFSRGIDAFYAPALLACVLLMLGNQEELLKIMRDFGKK